MFLARFIILIIILQMLIGSLSGWIIALLGCIKGHKI